MISIHLYNLFFNNSIHEIETMMKITTQGQVTIPASIRKSLGLNPGDRVSFLENDRGEVVLQRVEIDHTDPVEKAAHEFNLSMSADDLLKLLRDDD